MNKLDTQIISFGKTQKNMEIYDRKIECICRLKAIHIARSIQRNPLFPEGLAG